MSRVVLVHWHAAEGEARRERLAGAGHDVQLFCRHDAGGELTRALAASPPDALVIDLARLPSHGRAVATWLRERKALRRVPLVFVPGDAEKTERVRAAFPDATFAAWPALPKALAKVIAAPPADPVVPAAPDYSGTPLGKKLGVQPGGVLATVRAPAGFGGTLGSLPAGARHVTRLPREANVVVVFCRALAELRADWPAAAARLAERGSLWIAWPKRAARVTTDLTEDVVRAFGLDQGLVDTKVCAIDATWSGLRFSRRVQRRH